MKLQLHWQILISIILGVIFGFLSRGLGFDSFVVTKLSVLGTLFLRALKMIIVPLIVASIVSGVTGIGSAENLGRLSLRTFSYYFVTSFFAILIGLVLVNIIQPGVGANLGFESLPSGLENNTGKIGSTLLGIIPTNPLAAMVNGEMLPTIFFSLMFGFFITKAPKKAREGLSDFFKSLFDVMMKMTHFIISFAPIGIFALMAKTIAQTGFDVFLPLGLFILTVFIALMIHAVLVLPSLLVFIGKINPILHLKAMSSAILMAFSTASSSATLPLTMECVEDNAGVSNKVTSFVLPLGATINMDGTALYECVAAIFIAQVYGIDLSFGQQMIVVLTALLSSVGAAGIPMAGLVMMTIILKAVGLHLEGIGMILAVDRILDMLRTSVNNWSDSCGTVIIARLEGEKGLNVLLNRKT